MTFRLDRAGFSSRSRHEPGRVILHDVTLEIGDAECVGIIGEEGSGKTTLLQLLGALQRPDRGALMIGEVDPWHTDDAGAAIRRRIGYTFQFPDEQFLAETVAHEFSDVLSLHRLSAIDIAERKDQSLAALGLDPREFSGRSPFTLSLGESRRAALALAIATEPEALILDEPTAGMDGPGIDAAQSVIAGCRARGATVIMATHDVRLLAELEARVLMLEGGTLGAERRAADLVTDATLIGCHGNRVPSFRMS